MKNLLLSTLFMAIAVTSTFAQHEEFIYGDRVITQIQMYVYKVAHDEKDKINNGNILSFAPMKAPTIGFDGNTLYLYNQFGGLTLELVDNKTVVYSTIVEPNANEVALPDIPGTYELRLCDDRFVYSCEIDI